MDSESLKYKSSFFDSKVKIVPLFLQQRYNLVKHDFRYWYRCNESERRTKGENEHHHYKEENGNLNERSRKTLSRRSNYYC